MSDLKSLTRGMNDKNHFMEYRSLGETDLQLSVRGFGTSFILSYSFCREHDLNLTEVTLRLCPDYPRVTSTLVGMSTTEPLRRNLCSFKSLTAPDFLRQIKSILAHVANITWPSGRSENRD